MHCIGLLLEYCPVDSLFLKPVKKYELNCGVLHLVHPGCCVFVCGYRLWSSCCRPSCVNLSWETRLRTWLTATAPHVSTWRPGMDTATLSGRSHNSGMGTQIDVQLLTTGCQGLKMVLRMSVCGKINTPTGIQKG